MPEHKKQHFLAQQQMRRWSKTGRSIGALDKTRAKILGRVSIKGTGQQDYYYETEPRPRGVEFKLAHLETQMKEATDRIHEKEALPTFADDDRFVLMKYAATQLFRREQAARPFRDSIEQLAQITFEMFEKKSLPRPRDLEDFMLEMQAGPQKSRQLSVEACMQTWPILCDLEVMLLKSPRHRVLLPDDGALRDNRIAAATDSPSGFGSMGACAMLPLGPQYCVVWFDWGVFRRTTPGKIHEMTEDDEFDLGARSILQSDRLTYHEEGVAGAQWSIQCTIRAYQVQQAGARWIPIPGLQTPREENWGYEPQVMGVPLRPHIERALLRQQIRGGDEGGRTTPNETFRAIMIELEKLCPGKFQLLNEGR